MKNIKVWDIFVRVFHWSLALAVISQLATADEFKSLHVKGGYFIIVLLVLRVAWGFVGSRYARFTDFIYPPSEILAYLKGLFQGRPRHYVGHNPAGGAMVLALLFFLALTTFTGLLTYGAEGKGSLALQSIDVTARAWADDDDRYDDERHDSGGQSEDHAGRGAAGEKDPFWKEIHETLAGIIIFLASLHFCGVIASSYLHKENLILAMITGTKKTT